MNGYEKYTAPYNVEIFTLGTYWESWYQSVELEDCFYIASSWCQWDKEKEKKIRIIDANNKIL